MGQYVSSFLQYAHECPCCPQSVVACAGGRLPFVVSWFFHLWTAKPLTPPISSSTMMEIREAAWQKNENGTRRFPRKISPG